MVEGLHRNKFGGTGCAGQPVKNVRFPVMLSQQLSEVTWESHVSSPADSVRLILDGHGHILTPRSVKNAENVRKPVHTMRLQT